MITRARASVDRLWQDVRFALRLMRRSPGFTLVTAGSLALGIGANTAIFSLINAVMLRMLPVRAPEQLVELLSRYPGEPRTNGFAWKFYEHYRDQNHVFSDLIGVSPARFQISGNGMEPETLPAEYVTGNFFPGLGVEAAAGRLIGPQDDQLSAEGAAVAVLSWSCWKNRFNLDPAITGKQITIDGVPATIVGVAPRGFSGLQAGGQPALWVPDAMEPLIQHPSRRASGQMGVALIGRLKPGVSIEQARAEMSVLDRRRVEEIAELSKDPQLRQLKMEVEPAGAGFSRLRDVFREPLLVLTAIVGMLLLTTCANVASMLLARGAARQREMAVRMSLGASPMSLVRQMLTESVMLSVLGAASGIFLAYWGAQALVRTLVSGRPIIGLPQPFELNVSPDLRVLLFTAGIALLTGLLFGLAPAIHSLHAAPASGLQQSGRGGETKPRRLFGQSLVVIQVGLSVVLLSSAGLFVRHLSNLRSVDLGFRPESVLLVTLDPGRGRYEAGQLSAAFQEILRRLEAIPGVRAAAICGASPLSGAGASRFASVAGFQEEPSKRRYVAVNWVSPRYFETLGTPLLAGREFQSQDQGRSPVAIISQSMARYYFGTANPLGRFVSLDGEAAPFEVVGVSADAKYYELREPELRTIYLNAFQDDRPPSQFALKTAVPPESVAGDVRRVVREVISTVRVAKVTTLADQVDASIVPERLIASLSGLFGALGALLTGIGLYGLLAYTVSRRWNEIGVRMALGAERSTISRMVMRDAFVLVVIGLAIGTPAAYWARRFATALLADLPLGSPSPLVFGALAMAAIALLAAYLPARRASRMDPMEALRHE